MKKRYIQTAFAVVALLVLTACNNSELSDSTEQTVTTDTITITEMTSETTSVLTETVTTTETTTDPGIIPNTAGIVIQKFDLTEKETIMEQVDDDDRGVDGARKVLNCTYELDDEDMKKYGVSKKLVFQCIDSNTWNCDPAVFDRFNELLVSKYGCDFVVEFVGVSDVYAEGEYDYKAMLEDTRRLGQQADIITALEPSYSTLVEEDYFVELTDYLKNTDEGKKFYDVYPEEIWDMVTIDGKIYGYTTFSTPLSMFALSCNKSMAEELGIKVEDGFSFYDIGKLLEEADISEDKLKEIAPIYSMGGYLIRSMGYMDAGKGVYLRKDADGVWTAFNATEDEALIRLWKTLREYKEKGWLSIGRAGDILVRSGKFIFACNNLKDADVVDDKIALITDRDKKTVYDVIMGDVVYEYYGPRDAVVYGISTWSEYTDEALKLITLIQTEPEICNLLRYGIEGVHYKYENHEIKKFNAERYGTDNSVMQIVNPNLTYSVGLEPDNKLEFYKERCSNYEKDPRLDCDVTTDEYLAVVGEYDKNRILYQIYDQGYAKLFAGEYEDVEAAVAEINRLQKENGIDELINALNEMFKK